MSPFEIERLAWCAPRRWVGIILVAAESGIDREAAQAALRSLIEIGAVVE